MSSDKSFKILIPDHINPPGDIEHGVFGDTAEIITPLAFNTGDIDDNVWKDCDAILAYDNLKYEKDIITKLNKCKVIVRAGIGYDNIDIEEAKKKNIVVCNVPDYCTEEVADHTIAFILALVRGMPEHAKKILNGRWERKSDITFRIRGKVLGIIGLGRIGGATARRARVLGMKVIFYDPYIREGYDKVFDLERVDTLEDIAGRSDIISIHTPLTDETECMIDDGFFEKVKKNTILINTARGPIVRLDSLYRAMKKCIISACGLDVLSTEPPDSNDQLIADYKNDAEWLVGRLMITPHSAYHSHEALDEVRLKSALEAKRVLEGKAPRNCVN